MKLVICVVEFANCSATNNLALLYIDSIYWSLIDTIVVKMRCTYLWCCGGPIGASVANDQGGKNLILPHVAFQAPLLPLARRVLTNIRLSDMPAEFGRDP